MTRATSELGVSQPAVSRLISDLSNALELRLFDRRNGRLVPTQEARFLLPERERLSQTLDQIGEVCLNLNRRTAGHIKIACLPGFATSHLPQARIPVLQRPCRGLHPARNRPCLPG